MGLKEERILSQYVYRGKILNVRLDSVKLPDGTTGTREVVEFSEAVAVVALTDNNEVLLVRQYRYPVGRELLEIPAGKMEKGEQPEECARRELAEETGYMAANMRPLLRIYSTPGFTSEKMHLFFASGLTRGNQNLDEGEFVELVKIPLVNALKMIATGEICDAKSIIGLLTVKQMIGTS
ncbi:MAG: NUDIX hydrolase [Peptococcaceae bacterium]|nr:NUDIX hydrolase [Peptococcaceae bacterium]